MSESETEAAIEPLPQVSGEIAETTANTLAAMGSRIRELRQTRGLTLQELADVSGLSTSMLSLVERGRASPSIGSLIVIANALGVTMSDLLVNGPDSEEKIVVRASEGRVVETAQHVVRRLMREDRARGVSVAVNEYAPHTGSAEHPITHEGFEYGFVLQGELTVEVDGTRHVLRQGDLIAYSSRRKHKIWNHGRIKVRTLWFNLDRD
ncbi:helix-turn-helix domain-containing protein [Bradyrhizobium sp.]|uniref:helix-turn-helix domain-containing protein n=1 Tax=Bradyrhizobium sp. TaxID=376 RepID=UPI003C3F0C25